MKFVFLILGFWAQYWSKRPCRCCHQPHVWRWKWTELLDQVRWCVTCHTIGRSSPFGRWFCYAIRICRKSGAGAHREKNYGNSYILRKTNDGTSQSELPNCKEFFLLEAKWDTVQFESQLPWAPVPLGTWSGLEPKQSLLLVTPTLPHAAPSLELRSLWVFSHRVWKINLAWLVFRGRRNTIITCIDSNSVSCCCRLERRIVFTRPCYFVHNDICIPVMGLELFHLCPC